MADSSKRTRYDDGNYTDTSRLLHKHRKTSPQLPHFSAHSQYDASAWARPTLPDSWSAEYSYDGVRLAIPDYEFGLVMPLLGKTDQIGFAYGYRISDRLPVVVKLSLHSLHLEREYHIYRQLMSQPEGRYLVSHVLDLIYLPKDGFTALIFVDDGINHILDIEFQQLHRRNQITSSSFSSFSNSRSNIDIATFLDLAIGCCHCVEFIHRNSLVHGELQASAFHWGRPEGEGDTEGKIGVDDDCNAQRSYPRSSASENLHLLVSKERVKIWSFGSGLKSFEGMLMMNLGWRRAIGSADGLVDNATQTSRSPASRAQWKTWQNVLVHMSPEQTGRTSYYPDHRTDLYSLGIVFFTLLTRKLPFEGGPMDIIHSVLSRKVPLVHEVRPDVPSIISLIIEKLTSKSPDDRYNSANGLLKDLLECQRRLTQSSDSSEPIAHFPLGQLDVASLFTLPSTIFGRQNEIEQITSIIKRVADTHAQFSKGGSSGSETAISTAFVKNGTSVVKEKNGCEFIVVCGPGGIGKSTLVNLIQTTARESGYMAASKFDSKQQIPYSPILRCVSTILKQLLTESEDEIHRFYTRLRDNLGPQFVNVQLMIDLVPELKPILANMPSLPALEQLSSGENVARFHSVFLEVIRSIAQRRMLTLFLDDLQQADESSLDLIASLVAAKIKMIIIVTFRDKEVSREKMASIFDSEYARVTYIKLEPLDITSLTEFVVATLHRDKDTVLPMVELIQRRTRGNPLYARQLILCMKKRDIIYFDRENKKWEYDLGAMKEMLGPDGGGGGGTVDEADVDVDFLVDHLRELPLDAQKFLKWASLIGNVFDLKSIKYLMSLTDLDQSDLTNVDNVKQGIDGIQLTMLEESLFSSQPVSIRKRDEVHHQGKDVVIGLQILLQEGILLPIVEDEFRFMHDRYLHAAYLLADETLRQKMHLKIAEFLMQDASAEVFLIADHLIKSACLIAAFPQKSKYRAILGRAGDKASSSGALKMALSYYSCCLDLLTASPWKFGLDSSYIETLQLYLKVAELARWSNDTARAISLLKDVFSHAESPVDRTPAWRIRSQMHYLQQNYRDGLHDLFQCLRELGLQGIRLDITQDEVDELFYQLKGDIVRRGFNGLCDTPPCEDPRILSIMGVLQEAATVSYWHSPQLVDMMAMRLVQTSLVYGMSSASGPGFAWFGGAAANRYELYSFAADLGDLVVALCEKYSGHSEIARGYIAYALLLHQWKNRHIRTGMTFFEKAYKHALSGGDNVYSASALLHIGVIKFYIGENLDDTVEQLQRGLDESRETSSNTISLLFTGMIRTILALQGKTYATADAIFDDEFFREEDYVEESCKNTTDTLIPMSWYWSFKIVPLVLYGFYEKAAELGFDCIKGLDCHPCHRHGRMALFLHSVAMIACIREGMVDEKRQEQFRAQITVNQKLVAKFALHSKINYGMWHTLVEAELATFLPDTGTAAALFDRAIDEGREGDWVQDTAFAYELAGSFYLRHGMKNFAASLLEKSLALYKHWGAWGKARHFEDKYAKLLTSNTLMIKYVNDGCQTSPISTSPAPRVWTEVPPNVEMDLNLPMTGAEAEHALLTLDIVDLWSIIKSSQVMSSEMNFDTLLEKMMEIIMENSGAESGAIINKNFEGEYTIAAYSSQVTGCITTPKLLDEDEDRISPFVVNYIAHTREGIFIPNAETDARFAVGRWFAKTGAKSVISLPIVHKTTLVGALYIQANLGAFTARHMTVMTILCQQIGISVTNALLYQSIQKAIKNNLRMIESQKHALNEARKSKEAAEKAMQLKGNFLANMSHELRTPFSGFYSTISLLSDTILDAEQREFVQTAQQSCEMLLKIIDDLLNYTKLEAGKSSLDPTNFSVGDVLADVIELLITLASKKSLHLSYFLDDMDVSIVNGDASKLRQILMNLVGNAIKFTHEGEVIVRCTSDVAPDLILEPDNIMLRFSVQDTGIGMSDQDIKCLFEPFSQVDGSTTRNYGGTGLGLSICLQLVKLMGGEIDVKSEIGKGSTFLFTVKCRKAILNDEELALQRESETILKCIGSSRILVAAVCPATGSMIASVLAPLHVDSAISVDEAICKLSSDRRVPPYDILILDFSNADDVTAVVQCVEQNVKLESVRVFILYTLVDNNAQRQSPGPNQDGQHDNSVIASRVVRVTKPVRKMKLLRCFANTMNLTPLPPRVAKGATNSMIVLTESELAIFKTKKILVAEDNPVAQMIIVKQLLKFGCEVESTNNGLECLELWKNRGPGYFSIGFFDHHMPKCDGVEATKQIRLLEHEMGVENKMPIIALTADIQASACGACIDAGMNSYFTKPLMRDDLALILRQYCT